MLSMWPWDALRMVVDVIQLLETVPEATWKLFQDLQVISYASLSTKLPISNSWPFKEIWMGIDVIDSTLSLWIIGVSLGFPITWLHLHHVFRAQTATLLFHASGFKTFTLFTLFSSFSILHCPFCPSSSHSWTPNSAVWWRLPLAVGSNFAQ